MKNDDKIGIVCGPPSHPMTVGESAICDDCGEPNLWLSKSSLEAVEIAKPGTKRSEITVYCIKCAVKKMKKEDSILPLTEGQTEELKSIWKEK